jgi:hypothetical protein
MKTMMVLKMDSLKKVKKIFCCPTIPMKAYHIIKAYTVSETIPFIPKGKFERLAVFKGIVSRDGILTEDILV